MDFAATYEISRTAAFISERAFSRVALQFPDELLRDAARVVKALREELGKGVRLYVLADTTYGSCCVDEVGASHVDAQCVVHYGHACMSPTSVLPALFVFGKAYVDINNCAATLHQCLKASRKPVLVLYGLEYLHSLQNIKACMDSFLHIDGSTAIFYSNVTCAIKEPSGYHQTEIEQTKSLYGVLDSDFSNGNEHPEIEHEHLNKLETGNVYNLGGLSWTLPAGQKMEDFTLFWIGSENSAFENIVLTFNSCDIVRFDATENRLFKDFSHVKKILKRRYYLVEKAKDANIVGILVGTLGVAGYLQMIEQMKGLIHEAGKKYYIIVMGRPNSAKIANFPECDVCVYLSCAQTALLDSKNYLVPIITPFEAVLAFSRGRQWTGDYLMNFDDLIDFQPSGADCVVDDEARFSFLKGGYVEDNTLQEKSESMQGKAVSRELVAITERALNLTDQSKETVLFEGQARSAAEFLAARSYQGLDSCHELPPPSSYLNGRTGRASGYAGELSKGAR